MEQVHCFDVLVMSVLAFWIYRVQRISDDIHFLQGSQPTKFWKILWYTMPIIVGIPYFDLTCFDKSRKTREPYILMHFLSYFILISPIPIFMIYEVFRYLKIHNLVGILQPEERWGPPDPEERHLRHLFNPRQEIRSRRRDDTCQHNCLISSRYIKKISAEEREQRRRALRLLSLSQEGSLNISSGSSSEEWIQ
ncbi:hypothetical protein ILUMI_20346 [Ignelater luminosus]|uniref:Uncharacterized protein n=1 Tax=Ignelater luminosus TaxID=2038154 RepID=A0A8K0CID3_IGNLU|nr:hypothetical protein ILUMI_20346 [Ignelater luminosus]